MKASKLFIPAVATIAFAGIIGVAHAQTGTAGAPNNRLNDSTNTDAAGTIKRDSTGTMNRDSTGAMNRDSTGTMNRDTTGTMNRDSTDTTNRDSTRNMNRSSTGGRSNERVARADRN